MNKLLYYTREPGIFKKVQPELLLNVKNNASGTIPASLLQQGNVHDIANARTRYQWNITGLSMTNPITLQYRTAGSTTAYIIAIASFPAATSSGLVLALNALNVGTFWLETSGPNTHIVTFNDVIQYGNLTIGSAYASTATFTINATDPISSNTQLTLNFSSTTNGYVDWGDGNFGYFSSSGSVILTNGYKPGTYSATIYMDNAAAVTTVQLQGYVSSLNGLSSFVNLSILDVGNNDNSLSTIDISGNAAMINFKIYSNNISVAAINASLIALDGFGLLGGTYDSAGQTPAAAPTGAGAAAKLSLQGKGWSVTTD